MRLLILLGLLPWMALTTWGAKPKVASWYGEEYRGLPMANGDAFIPEAMTCATNHWPLGTTLEVKHRERTVRVVVTDRISRKYRHRIDLSHGAFEKLAHPKKGVIVVSIKSIRHD